MNEITEKLLSGNLTVDELTNFLSGKDVDTSTVIDYINNNPMEESATIPYSQATAQYFAEKNGYYLITERDDDIRKFWDKTTLAKNLSKPLAIDCINLVLPSIKVESPEDILELREKLKKQIIPFRMMTQKLATDLRTMLKDNYSIDNIRKESQFIVETKIEPALQDLKRKVELENDSFFIKLFGRTLSWIPLVGQIFFAPSPEKFFKLVAKVSRDTTALINEINNGELSREPGLSFLLGISEFGKTR